VLARLRYGAALEQALEVPGVARVLAVEEEDGNIAVVLEDLGARSLRSVLAEGRLRWERPCASRRRWRGRWRAARARVVHKGVEPSSILVSVETGEVRVTDLDLASRLDREEPAPAGAAGIEGSPAYMAPEQTGRMNRAVDYRADLYALGSRCTRCSQGRVPFEADEPAAAGARPRRRHAGAPERLRRACRARCPRWC